MLGEILLLVSFYCHQYYSFRYLSDLLILLFYSFQYCWILYFCCLAGNLSKPIHRLARLWVTGGYRRTPEETHAKIQGAILLTLPNGIKIYYQADK